LLHHLGRTPTHRHRHMLRRWASTLLGLWIISRIFDRSLVNLGSTAQWLVLVGSMVIQSLNWEGSRVPPITSHSPSHMSLELPPTHPAPANVTNLNNYFPFFAATVNSLSIKHLLQHECSHIIEYLSRATFVAPLNALAQSVSKVSPRHRLNEIAGDSFTLFTIGSRQAHRTPLV
jgi:hypothetical protein